MSFNWRASIQHNMFVANTTFQCSLGTKTYLPIQHCLALTKHREYHTGPWGSTKSLDTPFLNTNCNITRSTFNLVIWPCSDGILAVV